MRSSAAQRHRVNRVINFAQSHMDEALDLETLADVACLSKYHFTRVFNGHLRQTPIEFLSRLRLERAARSLAYVRDTSITEVAMDCGFSSSQAFSRAFRQYYRRSPRDFRAANRWHIPRIPAIHGRGADNHEPIGTLSLQDIVQLPVQIETRPDYNVAYVRKVGPYNNGSAAAAFAVVTDWARSCGLWREDSCLIGVCPDNTSITPPQACLYDACIPVPLDTPEDDIVSTQTIPGGTYAVLRAKCLSTQVYGLWEWLAGCWLPQSGETYALVSCYEFFLPADGGPAGPETGMELCMRIRTR